MTYKTPDLKKILKEIEGQSYPPVHKWNPEFCGDIDMHIDAEGHWHYMGSPIGRHRMVKLFSTILRKEGRKYYLVTPVEKIGIQVDDVPFVVTRMVRHGRGKDQTISFETNVGDKVILNQDHPLQMQARPNGDLAPYITVRDNLQAVLGRNIYYELAERAKKHSDNSDEVGVWSAGAFHSLGTVE